MTLKRISKFNTLITVLFISMIFVLIFINPSKSFYDIIYYFLLIILFVFSGFTSLDFYKYRKEEIKERAKANIKRNEIDIKLENIEQKNNKEFKKLSNSIKALEQSNFRTLQVLNNVHEVLLNDVLNKKELNEKLNITLNSLVLINNLSEDALFVHVHKLIIDQILISHELFKNKNEKPKFIDLEDSEEILKILKTILTTEPLLKNAIPEIMEDAIKILSDFSKKRSSKNDDVETKDLINHAYKLLLFRSYNYFSRSLGVKKQNSAKNKMKIEGDENTSLQNVNAETITINKFN